MDAAANNGNGKPARPPSRVHLAPLCRERTPLIGHETCPARVSVNCGTAPNLHHGRSTWPRSAAAKSVAARAGVLMLDAGMDAIGPEGEPDMDVAREALMALFVALVNAGYDGEQVGQMLAWAAHELDVEFYWEAEEVH